MKYLKILIIVSLASISIYSLAGFLLAPRVLKYWVETSIATEPGLRLAVGGVYVNPFTLLVALTDVTLFDGKNKTIVLVGSVETRVWTIEKFRSKRLGRDAEIRALQVNDPATGDTVLAAPGLSVTGLVVSATTGSIKVGTALLENPELHVLRDGDGFWRLPGWLPLPRDESPQPRVLFETLDISGGQLRVTDYALSPVLRLNISGIVGDATRRSMAGATTMTINVEGRFGESGNAEVAAAWRPTDWRAPTTVELVVRQIELAAVSPYFEQIAGRSIVAGIGDVSLHYERRDSTVQIENRVAVDGLRLGDRALADTGTNPPLDFAVAMLTDERDHIDMSIPILRGGVDAGTDPMTIVTDGFFDYVTGLAAMPFEELALLVGRDDEVLGNLAFPPGSPEITFATAEKISALARALERRPLLGLRAHPAYDTAADRDAIAAQEIRLHVNLATSVNRPGSGAQVPLDFDDPKVRAILDEFAGARLRQSQQDAISNRTRNDTTEHYRTVYNLLVANEDVSETALRRLARYRARSVVDALADAGVDRTRLQLADEIDAVTAAQDAVSVRLEPVPGARLPDSNGLLFSY